MTSTESTAGVSRLPSRPRSSRTFATIPDDDTHVTPAIASAPRGPQPRISAVIAPGAALRTMSTIPASQDRRRPPTRSEAEYSRPRSRSRRTTPTSLATPVNGSMPSSGSTPPDTEREPPEQVERHRRDAEAPGDAPEDAEPEEERAQLDEREGGRVHEWGSAGLEDRRGLAEPLTGADDDHEVAGTEHELRTRRRRARRGRGRRRRSTCWCACASRCRPGCGRRTASRRRRGTARC